MENERDSLIIFIRGNMPAIRTQILNFSTSLNFETTLDLDDTNLKVLSLRLL